MGKIKIPIVKSFLLLTLGSAGMQAQVLQPGYCWNDNVGWVNMSNVDLDINTRTLSNTATFEAGIYNGTAFQNGEIGFSEQAGTQLKVSLSQTTDANGNYPLIGQAFSEQLGWIVANHDGVNPASVKPSGELTGNFWSDEFGWVHCTQSDIGANANAQIWKLADIEVSETNLTIAENGGTGTFDVRLKAQPQSNVVIAITVASTTEAYVMPQTLTFTSSNWNIPQTVTVTGIDDTVMGDSNETVTVSIVDAQSDDQFDTIADKTIALTLINEDIDTDNDGTIDALDLDDDNDGVSDVAEIAAGTNPLDANSNPAASLAEVVEDIAGNANGTPATAAELNSITGVSGAVAGTDYSNALEAAKNTTPSGYADPANPTPSEIQAVIDAVNAGPDTDNDGIPNSIDLDDDNDGISDADEIVAGTNPLDANSNATASLTAITEDIAGNANGTPATAAELNSITGVSGAVDGTSYTSALIAGTYVDASNPTAVEIQTVIDAKNVATAVNAAPNTTQQQLTNAGVTNTVLTSAQLAQVNADIVAADPKPTTQAELQALVDAAVTTSGAVATAVNAAPSTTQQQLTDAGVTPNNLTSAQLAEVNAAIAAANPKPTTQAELQALVDAAVTTSAAVATAVNAAPNTTQQQLTDAGVTPADLTPGQLIQVNAAIAAADPKPTTRAELQAIVDAGASNTWYQEDHSNGSTFTYGDTNTPSSQQTTVQVAQDLTIQREENPSTGDVKLNVSTPTLLPAPAVVTDAPAGCDTQSYSAFTTLYRSTGEIETGYSYADVACGGISDATVYDGKRLRFVPGTKARLEKTTDKGGMVIIIDAELKKATKFGEK